MLLSISVLNTKHARSEDHYHSNGLKGQAKNCPAKWHVFPFEQLLQSANREQSDHFHENQLVSVNQLYLCGEQREERSWHGDVRDEALHSEQVGKPVLSHKQKEEPVKAQVDGQDQFDVEEQVHVATVEIVCGEDEEDA